MTAEEIRNAREESCTSFAQADLDGIPLVLVLVAQYQMLSEIAAQLAEMNERQKESRPSV